MATWTPGLAVLCGENQTVEGRTSTIREENTVQNLREGGRAGFLWHFTCSDLFHRRKLRLGVGASEAVGFTT